MSLDEELNIGAAIRPIDLTKINPDDYSFYGIESVVLNHDNKIILQQRGENWDRFPGYLTSFGGKIEEGETPMQALIRELNEELGARVDEQDVVSLGVVTEAVTNYTELIYVYFWHDKNNSITGCYEGEVRYYDSAEEVFKHPKIMDAARWALNECLQREILPSCHPRVKPEDDK